MAQLGPPELESSCPWNTYSPLISKCTTDCLSLPLKSKRLCNCDSLTLLSMWCSCTIFINFIKNEEQHFWEFPCLTWPLSSSRVQCSLRPTPFPCLVWNCENLTASSKNQSQLESTESTWRRRWRVHSNRSRWDPISLGGTIWTLFLGRH